MCEACVMIVSIYKDDPAKQTQLFRYLVSWPNIYVHKKYFSRVDLNLFLYCISAQMSSAP